MTDGKELLPLVGYFLNALLVGVGALLLWGIQSGIKAIVTLAFKVDRLDQKLEKIEKLEPRLSKVEEDLDEAHKKIRYLGTNNHKGD